MSLPAEGLEASWRNPLPEVSRFLRTHHGDKFMIFNLCAERKYDYAPFEYRVVEMGWPDHYTAPLPVLLELCVAIDAWLAGDPERVAVVHCLAGKGRTGVAVSSYLVYSGLALQPGLFSRPVLADARNEAAHHGKDAAEGVGAEARAEAEAAGNAPHHSESVRERHYHHFVKGNGAGKHQHQQGLAAHRRGGVVRMRAGDEEDEEDDEEDGAAHSDDSDAEHEPEDGAHGDDGDDGRSAYSLDGVAAVGAGAGRGSRRTSATDTSAAHHAALPLYALAAERAKHRIWSAIDNAVPPAYEIAARAMKLFVLRRGDGLNFAAQRRSVRYVAHLVRDAVLGALLAAALRGETPFAMSALEGVDGAGGSVEDAAGEAAPEETVSAFPLAPGDGDEAGTKPAGGDVESVPDTKGEADTGGVPVASASSASASAAVGAGAGAGGNEAPVAEPAVDYTPALSALRHLTFPSPPSVCVWTVVLHGVPVMKSTKDIRPSLQLRTQPHQDLRSESVFDTSFAVPSLDHLSVYTAADGAIVFTVNATMIGDVLLRLLHHRRARGGKWKTREVLRYSFNTAFLRMQQTNGPKIHRVYRSDVDVERRKVHMKRIPAGFYMDLMYEERGKGPRGDGDGETASTATDSTAATPVADPRTASPHFVTEQAVLASQLLSDAAGYSV